MKNKTIHLIFITLIAVTTTAQVYAEPATPLDYSPTSDNVVHKHKTPGLSQQPHVTTENSERKKVLIEESREMSPFFKLGIAINIVMILVFGWWFAGQWRANNKREKK